MLHVVLCEPEIPPNTGNVMRLCANTNTTLHLIEPLGFELEDTKLRRAGMDYREWADVRTYPNLGSFVAEGGAGRIVASSPLAPLVYSDFEFHRGDALLFGRESVGLGSEILESDSIDAVVRIPMGPRSRSLNLSNAVAVILYEALRQLGFAGFDA